VLDETFITITDHKRRRHVDIAWCHVDREFQTSRRQLSLYSSVCLDTDGRAQRVNRLPRTLYTVIDTVKRNITIRTM